jgi:hypothetical protein
MFGTSSHSNIQRSDSLCCNSGERVDEYESKDDVGIAGLATGGGGGSY